MAVNIWGVDLSYQENRLTHCIWLLVPRLIIPPRWTVSVTMCETLIVLHQQNQNRMSAQLIRDERVFSQCFTKIIKGFAQAHLRNQRTASNHHSFISTRFHSMFSASHCDMIGMLHRPPLFFQRKYKVNNTCVLSGGYWIQETLEKQSCNPDVNKQWHHASLVTKSNLLSVMTPERKNQVSQKIIPREILNIPLRDKLLSCHFIPIKQ